MNTIKNSRLILPILLVATLVRIVIFIGSVTRESRIYYPDELEYQQLAIRIIDNHEFGSTFRVPGYPAFISGIYYVFGAHPNLVFLIQIVINILTILTLYVLALRLFSTRVGEIAACLYLLDPLPAFYSMTVLSDTLFSFIFLVALSLFIFGMKERRGVWLALSGLALGLSILIRPVGQYLPCLLLFIIFACPDGNRTYRLKTGIVFIVCVMVAVVPWFGRNYSKYGAWALNTQLGQNMLYCNASLMESNRTHTPLPEVQKRLMGTVDRMGITNPYEKSAAQSKYALSLLGRHPVDYALVHLRGMVNMYISPDTRPICDVIGIVPSKFPDGFVVTSSLFSKIYAFFKYKSILEILIGSYIIVMSIALYLLSIAGFIILYQRKHWVILILSLATIGYFTIIAGPIGYGRLKLPIIPVYMLVAAYGLKQGGEHWNLRGRWRGNSR